MADDRPLPVRVRHELSPSVGPGHQTALLIVRRLWVALLVLCTLGIAAGLAWHQPTVLGLALVILVEETLEASVLVAVLKRSGAPLRG